MQESIAHRVTVGILTALLGAVLGWSANALTLSGRVSAIEASMSRIEAHLDRMEHRP